MQDKKKMFTTLAIILGPIILIIGLVNSGMVTFERLGEWDTAISIGALVSIMIYLFKDKKG